MDVDVAAVWPYHYRKCLTHKTVEAARARGYDRFVGG